MSHPAQLLSDPRRPYVPQGTSTDSAPTSDPTAHSPLPTALIPFDPPEPTIRKIIRDLADPTLSLAMTAREHNTDLDSLCVWMTRPDIAQRIFITESAFAVKTRLAAGSNMPMVAQTCQAIIHEFHDDQHHMNFKPQDPQGHEVKRRNRETSMRAGRLLMRLARYVPMSPAAVARAANGPRPQGGPTLRGGSSHASSESNSSDSGSPQSAIRNPKSEIALLALLDNPDLATQLADAIAARQARSSTPTTPPQSEVPTPKSDITPPTPASALPHPASNAPPDPRPPRSSVANSPQTPVKLTISARPILTAAGAPHARAP